MEFITGNYTKKTATKAAKKAPLDISNLPKGFKDLPEEMQHAPALKGRKNMTGVAKPLIKEDSSSSEEDVNDFVAKGDDGHEDSASENKVKNLKKQTNLKMRLRGAAKNKKEGKVPAHLAMSKDSGSDSDPQIEAPGWNLPQQKIRGGKKKLQDLVEPEHEESDDGTPTPPPKKAAASSTVKKGTKNDVEVEPSAAAPKKTGRPAKLKEDADAEKGPATETKPRGRGRPRKNTAIKPTHSRTAVRYRATKSVLPTLPTSTDTKRKIKVQEPPRNAKKRPTETNNVMRRCTLMGIATPQDERRPIPLPIVTDPMCLEIISGIVGFSEGIVEQPGLPWGWMEEEDPDLIDGPHAAGADMMEWE